MRNQRGSLIIDVLLSIFILVSLVSIIPSFLKTQRRGETYILWQDEISLAQLRRELLLAKDISIENNQLHYRIGKEEKVLSMVNKKLILQPGTQIFLENLEDISFEESQKKIYLFYRIGHTKRKVGIYVP
ncbi:MULTISPECIES: competence type IV pilus minor pilin ComGF [Terrabacteria group]|uniref:competence type IV pilus minor pilin ComGF n=1 Tax=Bacillati TaxID=1783272 RepID=UPI001C6E1618|nr:MULTISPECIES: competence type IV pilus minor pilin ComGF [Terrabacteria group]MBW9212403.1 ComGF family competence protein [Trueperella sp. zg.1013]